MTKGYEQIWEGEWYEPKKKGFVNQCCDCALTHVYDFAVVDADKNPIKGATVQFKISVDKRKTAAARRKLKFSKDEE
jgi:hypothetical protein